MKYIQLLIITLCISSCKSTKPITENQQTHSQETTIRDSIIENKKQTELIPKIKKITKDNITNNDDTDFNQTVTKREIELHQLWDELLKKHVSDDGIVNYQSFKTEHKKLLDYIYVLSFPHKNSFYATFSREEKLAYWINAYNAMTIDLILRHYPIKSIKDIKEPWKQRYWKLGSKWYNLNDIEHQILRKINEPRIHFAIVCASYSCPKLQNEAFTSEDLEQQLTKVTKDFLNDSERNSISENHIELSKIFKWFSKDFEQNGSLVGFLNQYLDIEISDKAKKSFKDYNWDLNE